MVILHDLADRPVTGVIVEVQRHIKRDKLLTWPASLGQASSIPEARATLDRALAR